MERSAACLRACRRLRWRRAGRSGCRPRGRAPPARWPGKETPTRSASETSPTLFAHFRQRARTSRVARERGASSVRRGSQEDGIEGMGSERPVSPSSTAVILGASRVARSCGLLACMSSEAPPAIELRPAGALIPPPHGQKNDSPDREDHKIGRHDTFRGAWRAHRLLLSTAYYRGEKSARPGSMLP